MRRRLALVDSEIEKIALAHLTEVPQIGKRPVELAHFVAQARQRFEWFTDRPAQFTADLKIDDQEIAGLRSARLELAGRIEHINATLPSIHDLPEGIAIARMHENLIEPEEHAKIATQDRSLAAKGTSLSHYDMQNRHQGAPDALLNVRTVIEKRRWLHRIAESAFAQNTDDPLIAALRSLIADASDVVEEQARYLQQPVQLPESVSTEVSAIVARLDKSDQVFVFFAFKEKAHRTVVESIQVVGRSPENASDWAHVRDHLKWREKVFIIHRRWEALAVETGAPQINLSEIGALQLDARSTIKLQSLVKILRAVVIGLPEAVRQLNISLPQIALGAPTAVSLWSQRERLAFAGDIVRSALIAARLSAAKEEIKRIADQFPDRGGNIASLARAFLNATVGKCDIEASRIERAWDGIRSCIDDLAQHRTEFETVRNVADQVRTAGAPEWAVRILSEPAKGNGDPLTPPDWREAWDWATSEALRRIDQPDYLRRLSDERPAGSNYR
jgi:hypothetical protein